MQRPLQKHSRIEADLFCDHCGYNLHSQPVIRDERLGILIVQCTECGRFQPAAVASSAGRVWLNRLGAIIVAAWGLFVFAVIIGCTIGLAGIQVGHIELFTTSGYFAPDGSRLYQGWDPTARKPIWIADETGERVTVTDPPYKRFWRGFEEFEDEKLAGTMVSALMLLSPVAFGAILSLLLWHVPRRWYWLPGLLPLIGAGFVIAVYHVDEFDRGGDTALVAKIVLLAAVVQVLLTQAGTRIGRPIARFLVTLLVPPKPRQALAFLWGIDGKTFPKSVN